MSEFKTFNFPNFKFKKDLKYCNFSIGNYSQKDNPIKKSILEAKEFVYIISPYLSEELTNLLPTYNKNITTKLICSYTTENNNITNLYLKIFRNFLSYSTIQSLNIFKSKINEKYNNYLGRTKLFIRIFSSFIIFSFIMLALLYYYNRFTKKTLVPLGLFFIISLILFSYFNDKKNNISKMKENEINKFKNENPPDMEWNLDVKITKNFYNSYLSNTPFFHVKLYLMDCPALTKKYGKTVTKAFIGSCNFTSSGFFHNFESLLETTDLNFTEELKAYFENLYDYPYLDILSKKELCKMLQEKNYIHHLEK